MKTLCEIELNKEYEVVKLIAQEPTLSRLISMGFAKGSKVKLLKSSARKQTFQYKIEDSEIALRLEEAKHIYVKSEK